MIHIEQNQIVPDNPNLLVFSPTGDYDDADLIECYGIDDPTLPVSSFQAQYIKYGGLIYHYNEPKELGEAILKIDPLSTHSAASYVRMSEDLLKKMNAGSIESNSLIQTISDEQIKMQDQILDQNASTTATTTENNIITPAPETVSEPKVDTPVDISTSIDTNVSTTTPEQISTSTDSVLNEIVPDASLTNN